MSRAQSVVVNVVLNVALLAALPFLLLAWVVRVRMLDSSSREKRPDVAPNDQGGGASSTHPTTS